MAQVVSILTQICYKIENIDALVMSRSSVRIGSVAPKILQISVKI
nr:MAG TPA: hypothetical protein [Caudoviricetes sp.]